MGKFIEKTLPNGLKVYFYQEPEARSINVTLLAKTGKAFEKKEESGIAHFAEHMMFNGTEKYPNKSETMDVIWSLGGKNNGRTGLTLSTFPVKVREEDFRTALDVLYQETQKAIIDESLIEKEKDVIVEEIRKSKDKTTSYVYWHLLNRSVYTYESLKDYPGGNEETVRKFTHKQILNWYKKSFVKENMAILVVTRKDPEKLILDIEEIFRDIPSGEALELNEKESEPEETIIVEKKALNQTNISFGFQIEGYLRSDPMTFSFLARILSFQIYDRVRIERQLSYDPNVGLEVMPFVGRLAGLVPANREKTIEALKVILEVFEKIKTEIDDKSFVKARNMILTYYLFSQEKASSFALDTISKTMHTGVIEKPEERVKIAEKITKEDVIKLANEFLNSDHLRWAFLGNIDEKTEKEIRELLQ